MAGKQAEERSKRKELLQRLLQRLLQVVLLQVVAPKWARRRQTTLVAPRPDINEIESRSSAARLVASVLMELEIGDQRDKCAPGKLIARTTTNEHSLSLFFFFLFSSVSLGHPAPFLPHSHAGQSPASLSLPSSFRPSGETAGRRASAKNGAKNRARDRPQLWPVSDSSGLQSGHDISYPEDWPAQSRRRNIGVLASQCSNAEAQAPSSKPNRKRWSAICAAERASLTKRPTIRSGRCSRTDGHTRGRTRTCCVGRPLGHPKH